MNTAIEPSNSQPAPAPANPLSIFSSCGMVVGLILAAGMSLVVVLALIVGPNALADVHERSGTAYLEQRDYTRAIREFDQAIELNPSSASAYDGRGVAYGLKGDPERAIADFDKAISLKPDYAPAYYDRGYANLILARYDRAIPDFDKFISMRPDFNPNAYYNRGKAYYSKGSYREAIADFSKALELNPSLVEVYSERGHAYIEVEDYRSAVADYDQFIKKYPNDPVAYNNRCWSYFKMGQYKQALPDCELSIKLNPYNPSTLDSRARVYKALGRIDEANADFENIIKLSTDPELSNQARQELGYDVSGKIISTDPGINVAMWKTVRVSRALSGWPSTNAVNGRSGDWWGSGAFAPQWIEIDLTANYVVAAVRLLPSQSPSGATTHRLLVNGSATGGSYVLVHTFEGVTQDGQWLVYELPEPLQGVRYVRIETTSSPSWVSWREVQVIAGE